MTLRRILMIILLGVLPALITLRVVSGDLNGQTPDLNALSDADLKTLTARLERTGCYGNCPAYTVMIHGDGRVEYAGRDNVKMKETRAGHIEPEAVKALIKEFARAKFLSIADQYSQTKCTSCRRCTDMPSAITELTVGGVIHRVTHYYGCGCAPQSLFELEAAIDKAIHVEQWTGDVSKQGPFGTTCFGP